MKFVVWAYSSKTFDLPFLSGVNLHYNDRDIEDFDSEEEAQKAAKEMAALSRSNIYLVLPLGEAPPRFYPNALKAGLWYLTNVVN